MAANRPRISTGAKDWKERCAELAKSKKEFELTGYVQSDFHFCEKFCFEHGYTVGCIPEGEVTTMVFRPGKVS